jgi:hypothetical protein
MSKRGKVLHSETCQGSNLKLRATRFVQWVKVFDVISTGDHGAVSVREFGDDEQD